MTLLEGLLYGVVQGLTEFLPVSSSGHLAVLKELFGQSDTVPLLFDVLLHVATLVVVVWYFRPIIGRILNALARGIGKKSQEDDAVYQRLALYVIVATGVTTAMAFGFRSLEMFDNIKVISALFIFTGILLVLSSRFHGTKDYGQLTWKASLAVGFAQGLGTLAGVSRSGSSIAGGQIMGLRRDVAGEFSFLLSIPAILGALVVLLLDADNSLEALPALPVVIGVLSAMVSGWLALAGLMRLVKKGKLQYFALYLVPLGIVGLLFF